MYRIRETGAIVTQNELLAMYPNTSFPEVITPEIVDSLGADPILETPAPPTTVYQTAQHSGVSQDAQGNWIWDWIVIDWTPEQIEEYNNQQKEANKQTASQLLQQTDWTTIPDVSNPEISNPYLANVNEFIVYRNQVRAIAVNPPVNVENWPDLPQEVWESK